MYTFSESALQDQFRNKCFKTGAKVVLKMFGTKDFVLYDCCTISLKMNVFFYLSLGVTEILSLSLTDQ